MIHLSIHNKEKIHLLSLHLYAVYLGVKLPIYRGYTVGWAETSAVYPGVFCTTYNYAGVTWVI